MTRTGLGLVVRRELSRIPRRRLYPMLLFVMPVAGWFTLGSAFVQRVPRDLPVAVVDDDASALSRAVTRALDATPSMRVIAADPDRARTGAVMRDGTAYAVVVIPAGLERGVLRGETSPVTVLYNAQWLVPGNLILRDSRAALGTLSASLDARRHVAAGLPPDRAVVRADPLRAELHPLFNPSLDYAAFLFLALVPALFHMFVLLVTVDTAGRELKQATARVWLRSAGGSTAVALAGKLLPYTAWFWLTGSLLLELSLRWVGVPPAGSRLLLHGAAGLLVVAYQAVGLLLVAVTANLRIATTAVGLIAAPSFAVAGVSFPLQAMPLAAQAWAAALPLTHYLAVQSQAVIIGGPAAASVAPLAALVAFVAAGFGAAALRFPRLLREPRWWGRS